MRRWRPGSAHLSHVGTQEWLACYLDCVLHLGVLVVKDTEAERLLCYDLHKHEVHRVQACMEANHSHTQNGTFFKIKKKKPYV